MVDLLLDKSVVRHKMAHSKFCTTNPVTLDLSRNLFPDVLLIPYLRQRVARILWYPTNCDRLLPLIVLDSLLSRDLDPGIRFDEEEAGQEYLEQKKSRPSQENMGHRNHHPLRL